MLRLLLNYDVPQRKLLNVVLFGQSDLRARVDARRNLADAPDHVRTGSMPAVHAAPEDESVPPLG